VFSISFIDFEGKHPCSWIKLLIKVTCTLYNMDQAQFWARANRCDTSKKQSEQELLTKINYECPHNADVVYYIVKDGSHSWPSGNKHRRGGDEPSYAIDATQVIIDFFLSHKHHK